MIADWVHVDGALCAREDAKVSAFDHGFLYGDGVFEGVAVVNGAIFKLDAHLDRLYDSARYLAIDPPSRTKLRDAILETARKNGLKEGYLRVVVTRGAGPVGIRNMDKLRAPTVVIIAQHETGALRAAVYANGLRAIVSSLRRSPPQCIDGKAKTCNYLNNVLSYLEAKDAGADTAILLDVEGFVAEDYAANIFCVRGGKVRTPALGSILNGITRQTVLSLCTENAIPFLEEQLTLHDLYCADEVFETGSLAEVKPITAISGRRIGTGKPGTTTQRLHKLLRDQMESRVHSVSF